MNEIICGAGGFVGTNLRRYLSSKEKNVVVLPIEMLLSPATLHVFLKNNEPYNLYYLAAYGNLRGQFHPHYMYQAMLTKLLYVLEATLDTKCEAILIAGSTSEYGNKTAPMKETDILQPVTIYGAAKAAATHLAQVWAKQYDSPIVVFRPASITGVGEQSIHLIPTLIRSCLLKEKMPFEGGYYHDYINVLDVCSALEILSKKAKNHKGEIFNIGSNEQISNLTLKEMIESITCEAVNINKDIKINPDNVSAVWIADNSKMQALGWKPTCSLYDTLQEMIKAL